ncbi:hypothetical protein [Sphingobium sp.]|uniref:hypothetical protein n=1 Tax=Sphingobium sp. TaxID=1912891 RepID=UPI002E1BEFD1
MSKTFMRWIFRIASISILLPASFSNAAPRATAPKAPVIYGFKGAQLGMSLQDLYNLPIEVADTKPASLACSNTQEGRRQGAISSIEEDEIGIVVCQYRLNAGSDTSRATIRIGRGYTDNVNFRFYDGQLFKIYIEAGKREYDEAVDGLVAKYGDPDLARVEEAESTNGQTFSHEIMTWENSSNSVVASEPWVFGGGSVIFRDYLIERKMKLDLNSKYPSDKKM